MTSLALVSEYPLTGTLVNGTGLHQTTTFLRTITRIHINMLTPQAGRAVVGVAITQYFVPTMITTE